MEDNSKALAAQSQLKRFTWMVEDYANRLENLLEATDNRNTNLSSSSGLCRLGLAHNFYLEDSDTGRSTFEMGACTDYARSKGKKASTIAMCYEQFPIWINCLLCVLLTE